MRRAGRVARPRRLERLEAALRAEKAPLEDLLSPWRSLASAGRPAFAAEWRKLAERYAKEDREREEFNAEEFVTFADFRSGGFAGWQASGQGLREGAGRSGDFALNPEGEALVRAVLPAGCFTHASRTSSTAPCGRPRCPGASSTSASRSWAGGAARSAWSRTTASSTTGTTAP